MVRNYWQEKIRLELAQQGHIERYAPRHIEAFIRIEHSTLDWMDKGRFALEVEIARKCIDAVGSETAEVCARSLGLREEES